MTKITVKLSSDSSVVDMYTMQDGQAGVVREGTYAGDTVFARRAECMVEVVSLNSPGAWWNSRIFEGGCKVELYPVGTKITIEI